MSIKKLSKYITDIGLLVLIAAMLYFSFIGYLEYRYPMSTSKPMVLVPAENTTQTDVDPAVNEENTELVPTTINTQANAPAASESVNTEPVPETSNYEALQEYRDMLAEENPKHLY